MATRLPRGIRNNNPGNIRKNGQAWLGLAKEQPDEAFFTFSDPVYGIRAIAKIVGTYRTRYGLQTIDGIIRKWAPPNENDTGAYVQAVSSAVGILPTAVLLPNQTLMLKFLKAIVMHENGVQPYDDMQFVRAMTLAGIPA